MSLEGKIVTKCLALRRQNQVKKVFLRIKLMFHPSNTTVVGTFPSDIYRHWQNHAVDVATSDDTLLGAWRRHPAITHIVETVTGNLGVGIYNQIKSKFNLDDATIQELCDKNDRLGSPTRYWYGKALAAPTSLRYVLFACEILTRIREKSAAAESSFKSGVRILEVGGGYGGLALVILLLAKRWDIKVEEYRIYDLEAVQQLQHRYFTHHVDTGSFGDTAISWGSSQSTGNELPDQPNWYFVSCYAVSEFEPSLGRAYLSHLVPKTQGGFFAWNSQLETDLLPSHRVEESEIPLTGPHNKIVYY